MNTKKIYVSKKGNDMNTGSIEEPIFSLKEAIDRLGEIGGEIYVREGRYRFFETLEIVGKRNIKIMPYENETVYFDGGAVIPNERVKKLSDEDAKKRIINKKVLNDVYEADLSGLQIQLERMPNIGFCRSIKASPNELFINTKPQTIVKYPKDDKDPYPLITIDGGSKPGMGEFERRKPVIGYEDDRCSLWKEAKDASLSGYFVWSYAHDIIGIEKIDTEKKTITLNSPHYGRVESHPYCHWRIVNLLEEISEKGEYYIDCEKEKIYFIPGESIENALLEISSLPEPLIAMENSENITVDGFIMENSRYSAVYIEGGENCLVKNCTIRNIGVVGIQIGKGFKSHEDGTLAEGKFPEEKEPPLQKRKLGSFQVSLFHYAATDFCGGKNNGIDHCEIYSTGAGGVILNGGNRKKLEHADNFVTNCRIYDVNRFDKTYKAGIHVLGCGNRIAHCEIFDMSGFAIYIHGNDHIIEYNDVHDAVKDVSDAGAIYMGHDISEVGNIIRYNHIHDLKRENDLGWGICAIYFDDSASFNQVYLNYFTKVTAPLFGCVLTNRGCGTSIAMNIYYDCPVVIRPHFSSFLNVRKDLFDKTKAFFQRAFAAEDDYRGVDITTDAYRNAYPYLYDLYTGDYKQEINIWSNYIIDDKNYFVDYENGDYTLKESWWPAVCYQTGVNDSVLGIEDQKFQNKIIDFKEIGIQKS